MDLNRKLCSSVDHAYAQVTLVWCPHDQAWSLLTSSWVEHGEGAPSELQLDRLDFGPFDDAPVVQSEATARLVAMCRRLVS